MKKIAVIYGIYTPNGLTTYKDYGMTRKAARARERKKDFRAGERRERLLKDKGISKLRTPKGNMQKDYSAVAHTRLNPQGKEWGDFYEAGISEERKRNAADLKMAEYEAGLYDEILSVAGENEYEYVSEWDDHAAVRADVVAICNPATMSVKA